jgi:hypothetical protein
MKPTHLLAGALVALLPALALTFPSVASATVITWHYDAQAQWDTAQTVFTDGNGSTTNTTTTLAWGNTEHPQQSSLVINPASSTGNSVDTNGPASDPGFVLTHNNFVISLNSHILQSAVLLTTIDLTPFNPLGSPLSPINLDFGIRFTETPNNTPCADTSSPTPCNDIFVIDNTSLNTSFDYLGDTYFASLFPLSGAGGINLLTNAECAAAGVASGCFGFTTVEDESNPLHFGLTVTTAPIGVPEPSSLLMMGLGLFGMLGFLGLRRKFQTDKEQA